MEQVVIQDVLKNVERLVSPELRLLFEHMLDRLDALEGNSSPSADTSSDAVDLVVSKRRQASNG